MYRVDVVKEKDVISIDNLVLEENVGIREAMSLMERMKRSKPRIDPWVVQKGLRWDMWLPTFY